MIAALTGWVKSIVFVVLFACFLELLLPESSIRKFVRVVMGLFIMMTILNPVVRLMDNNGYNEVETNLAAGFNNFEYDSEARPVDAAQIRQKQLQLAKEHYLNDLAKQIRATVLAIGEVAEAKVVITLAKTPTAGGDTKATTQNFAPQIDRIVILVNLKDKTALNEPKIDKIVIGRQGAANSETASLNPQVEEKIKRTVSELYHIRLEKIEVSQNKTKE